ncbi:oocyte zinc finger protein XlCOF7.1-like [Pseudophryne corroboree]|uniref:oocyte zinc finger protein XlCOF7.1-like n=1 Tax=Pseudophryne corroboree TaxID=495146 RepID=UPI0030819B61
MSMFEHRLRHWVMPSYKDQSCISEFLHHSLVMNKDRITETGRILNLTLEIIFLLTGEDFVLTKREKDPATGSDNSCLSDQSPITEPPSYSLANEETTDKKTLELDKAALPAAEKVPVRCEDVAVFFSVEEWEYLKGHKEHYKDVIMESHQPPASADCDSVSSERTTEDERLLGPSHPQGPVLDNVSHDPLAGGCSSRNPADPCETPLYSPGCIEEENRTVTQEYQDEPGHVMYHRQCKEEAVPAEISPGGCSSRTPADPCETPLYSPGCIEEENRTVTQEYQDEPGHVIHHRQCKEEAVPAEISPGVLASWKVQGDSPHSLLPVQGHQTNVPTPDFPLGIILSENSAKDSSRRAHAVPDKAPALKRPIHVTDLVKKQRKVDHSSVNFIGHGDGNQNKEQTTDRMVYKCRRTYYSEIDPAAHQRTNSDERRYLCGECPLSFTDISVLEAHQWNFHRQELGAISAPQRPAPEDRPFSCSECGRSFTKKSTLVKHQRIHTGAFACPDCGKCLSDKTGLILHRRTHTGEKPFACSECGRRFTQMCHLVTHQSVHTREKPFACTECGKCFSIRSVLIAHQAIHARHKTFRCPECGKSFTQKADLATHWRVHSKEPGSTS